MTTNTPAATSSASVRALPPTLTPLGIEVRDEMRLIRREPAALFFSIVMPVMFYALFVALFGGEAAPGAAGLPAGTLMLATFGTYGAIMAAMATPGIGLAAARESGWFEVAKVSPVPVPVILAAKVAATVPYIFGILTAMTAASAALGVLEVTPGQWLAVMAALVVGSQSFALVGLAVGSLVSANATTAILNAIIMPTAIASGLWFPLEIMPDGVSTLAQWLPTYHLAQLAAAPLEGGPWLTHLVVLGGFTIVTGGLATMSWRRARP